MMKGEVLLHVVCCCIITHQYKGESQCKQSFAKVKEFIRLIDLGDKVMSS